MNPGQQVRISPTYGNANNLDDATARNQLGIIVTDMSAQSALFKNLYEVRLLSGPAAGETRLVTFTEMTVL